MKNKFEIFLSKIILILKKPQMGILPGHLAFFFVLSIIPLITLLVFFGSLLNIPSSELLEFFNTALEHIVDMISPDINPHAKNAKDMASSGVLAMAVISAIVGLIIFIPKFVELIGGLLWKMNY